MDPYYINCLKCCNELFVNAVRFPSIQKSFCISASYVLGFFIHIFTNKGREIWINILEKYYVFLQISLGVWTEKAYESYEIPGQMSDNFEKYQSAEG